MPLPRAIIVDDSATLRSVLRADLESAGWAVTEAADGEAAALSAMSEPPDVLISDIWMPGINGLQLCRLLAGEEATRKLPVVLLTGSGDRRARFWASRSGAMAFVSKGELRTIPSLIDSLKPKIPAPSPSRPRAKEMARHDVGRRLSDVLDDALFHTVFAGEVQNLAASTTTHCELMNRFASLLSEVLSFRWVALVLPGTGEVEDPPEALRAEVAAIVAKNEHVIAEAGDAAKTGPTALVERTVVHAGEVLGRLVIALGEARSGPADDAVVETSARALAVPIRLMSLLVEGRMLACTDALTALPNRRHGELVLTQSLAVAERSGQPISVAFLDIDHFKKINDTHGHDTGDRVLKFVGSLLAKISGEKCHVARHGGEEFVMVFRGKTAAEACEIVDQTRADLASRNLVDRNSGERMNQVSFSGGVADAFAYPDPRDALKAADQALYLAKEHGRNRVYMAKGSVAAD